MVNIIKVNIIKEEISLEESLKKIGVYLWFL